jgi:uncharacterized membrane protein YdjX (TVP38/TMEM64 family)
MLAAMSTTRRVSRLTPALAAVTAFAGVMAVTVATLAQDAAPPQPTLNRYPAVVWGYLAIFVLLGLVVGVSILPSKRGHQD